MVTETIDRLFLEMSQFTTATTAKEIALEQRLKELESKYLNAENSAKFFKSALEEANAVNDQLTVRLKEQADAYSELIAQLHRDVAERDGEIKRLREALREIIDMPILYEDVVTDSLRDIASKALGGGE